MRRTLSHIATIAALAMTASACGGSSDESSTVDAPATEPATDTTAETVVSVAITEPAATTPASPPTTAASPPTTAAAPTTSAASPAPTSSAPAAEPDEIIDTPYGEVAVMHDFVDPIDGWECVPGTYDVVDEDVQRWYDVFLGVNEAPMTFNIDPGSGGTFTFDEATDNVTLALVATGTIDSDVGGGTFEMGGTMSGTYEQRADNTTEMRMVLDDPNVDVVVSIGGITMSGADIGINDLISYEGMVRYECYDTGLLSLWWPTDGGTGDGPAPIIDMIKRGT